MEQYQGSTIYEKIAIGRMYLYDKDEVPVVKEHTEDTEAEIIRLKSAQKAALAWLDVIYQRALDEVGADDAAIFEVHKMMLCDADYLNFIRGRIRREKLSAEYAVKEACEHFAGWFAQMEDPYMRTRAADLRDISGQLAAVLTGNGVRIQEPDMPVILLTDNLTPSETVLLDKSKILAFVTRHGSSDSHASFLTRAMEIPAVTGIDFRDDWDGRTAIVDGSSGMVIVDPDPATLEKMTARMSKYKQKLREL